MFRLFWKKKEKKIDKPFREQGWQPRIFKLKKEIPSIYIGANFWQSHLSDNIYFHGIPISSNVPEKDQVGVICFEAKYVESNSEWFEEVF